MLITKKWLQEKSACPSSVKWFLAQKETDAVEVLNKLIKEDKSQWANWAICRVFNYKQRVQYAVFAAEQVISIYEKKYPNDKRPRKAIEAAKKCINNPSEKNKNVATTNAYAANTAACAIPNAYAANIAAYAAAYAANTAAYATAYAPAAADAAAYTAADALQKKILEYGLKLLRSNQ